MAIVRTAKGTVTDKTSAVSMTIANMQIDQFKSLVVGVAFNQEGQAPNITWGARTLRKVGVQQANGAAIAVYRMYRSQATATNDLVIDWTGKTIPEAKAAFATMYLGARRKDLFMTNSMAATNVPRSGALASTTYADEALIGAFCSEGPVSDSAGTPSLGWSAGQRAGTAGGADDTNITIQETYLIQSAIADTRARLSGVTIRDFSIAMLTLEPEYTGSVSVTVSVPDVQATSQAQADSFVQTDVTTRFPSHYTVTVL